MRSRSCGTHYYLNYTNARNEQHVPEEYVARFPLQNLNTATRLHNKTSDVLLEWIPQSL